MQRFVAMGLGLTLGLTAPPAPLQARPPLTEPSALQLTLTLAKRVPPTEAGAAPTWAALDRGSAQPGDRLRYTLRGQNRRDRPLRNLTLTQPIPSGTVYVLDSALRANRSQLTFSIDGGQTYVARPIVKRPRADGRIEEQPAPASQYTHVRWQVPTIAPQSTFTVSYQVQVR